MRASEVHQHLATLSRELVELLATYQAANLRKAETEQAAKVAYAKAFLAAEGSVEERKQQAVLAAAQEASEAEIAATVFDNTRAALRVLGQRLDAGRTIASTIRAEAIATGETV